MLERQKQTAIGLGKDVFIRAGGRAHFPTLAWQKCGIILWFLSTNQMLCSSGVGDWEFDSNQCVSPIAEYSCGHRKLLERAVSSYSRWLYLEMDSEAAKKFVEGKAETICNQNIINLSWAPKLVKCLLTALDSYVEDSKLWFETGMETRIEVNQRPLVSSPLVLPQRALPAKCYSVQPRLEVSLGLDSLDPCRPIW